MNSRRGFTLLETMIAMVILSASLVLLTSSWGGSFMRIRKTQANFEIAALLERKMADVEIKYRGKSLDDIPEEETDNFGDEYSQYSWTLTSRKLEFPDMGSSLTSKEGGASEMLLMIVKQLTDTLEKAIKEVTVTVTYTGSGSGKKIEQSVTTYFIDFDKEVGGMGVPPGMAGAAGGGEK